MHDPHLPIEAAFVCAAPVVVVATDDGGGAILGRCWSANRANDEGTGQRMRGPCVYECRGRSWRGEEHVENNEARVCVCESYMSC